VKTVKAFKNPKEWEMSFTQEYVERVESGQNEQKTICVLEESNSD